MSMFKNLRNRLLVLLMSVISACLLIAFSVVYISTYTNVKQQRAGQLDELSSRYISSFISNSVKYVPGGSINFSQSFVLYADKNGKLTEILSQIDITDSVYQTVMEEVWNPNKPEGKINIEGRKWQYRTVAIREDGKDEITSENGDYKISFIDITDSSHSLTRLFITLAAVWLAMLAVIFLLSLYFSNRSIRPIEESWRKQKQFVADASHELKTPLAIINSNTEALLANGEETINSQKKWLTYIQGEISHMGKLIGDMLYLAKMEDTEETRLPVPFSETILDILASFEAVIFEKEITLIENIKPDVMVLGDSDKLKQAVMVLMDNAVKYTEQSGEIIVDLWAHKGYVVFTVKNTGERIAEKDLPYIFDRFYRGDESHGTETGGFGLGLSIAKAAIKRMGGKITAKSNEKYTTFQIELKQY